MNTMWGPAMAAALLTVACGAEGEEMTVSVSPIIPPGAPSTAHPEVAQITVFGGGGSCSAVLIQPRYLLSNSHCFASTSGIDTTGGAVQFVDTNGNQIPGGFTWTTAYRFTLQAPGYAAPNDIALVRITPSMPVATVRPATIATRRPTVGESVQVVGWGCNNRTTGGGVGVKRMATVPWPSNVSCPGDSGGGLFLADGTLGYVIAAPGDLFGDIVDHKFEIEEMIRSLEGFDFGVDRPGNDINNFITPTAASCKTLCFRNSACRAFSYELNISKCWLKRGVMKAAFNDNNVSGTPDEFLTGFDSIGNVITSFAETDIRVCGNRCAMQRTPTPCVAYTVNADTGRCTLKSAVAQLTTNAAVTLGILRSPEAKTDRVGGDFANLPASSAGACMQHCEGDSRCLAWTLNGGTCFLKDLPTDALASSVAQSGFRRGLEFFQDYRGSDLTSFTLPGVGGDTRPYLRPQVCQAACRNNGFCRAWTMDRTSSTCFLKSAIPTRVSSPGSVTGRSHTGLFW
jgi:hypothetical protein